MGEVDGVIGEIWSTRISHDDFNEFNLLGYEGTTEVVVIDFPQMVNVVPPNAEGNVRRGIWIA